MERIEILARLLKEDQITLEEFKLLMEKEVVFTYRDTHVPQYPFSPFWWQNPVTCGETTTGAELSTFTIN